MKIVVVEPMENPIIKEIDGTLEEMQSIVGGLIQMIMIDNEVALLCDDEGKLKGKPLNRALYMDDEIFDVIGGTFFICSAPTESDDFEGLTDEQAEFWRDKFWNPELYIKTEFGLAMIEVREN